MNIGDIVLIFRPRLPTRIGRLVRFGKTGRIYVRFRDGKLRRYSASSVRTGIARLRAPLL